MDSVYINMQSNYQETQQKRHHQHVDQILQRESR